MELQTSKLGKFTRYLDNNFICFTVIAPIIFLYFRSSITNFYYTDDPYWIYIGKKIFTTGILSTYPFYYRIIPGGAFGLQHVFFNSYYIFYHIVNICIFILNCYMFFSLMKLLFDSKETAFFSTVIFILSPINFEKINWISMQIYLWFELFYLFTVYYFLKYIKSSEFSHYFLFICGYSAALWTNEIGITLIFILSFLYYGFNFNCGRNISCKRFIIDFLPIFIISTIYLVKIYNYYFRGYFVSFKFDYLQLLVKLFGFAKFFLYSLNYIALLIPARDFWFNPYFIKYIIPAFLILLSLSGSFYIRLSLLFIILPVLPIYFGHFQYFKERIYEIDWTVAAISSLGFIMIYGFLLAKSIKILQSLENKRMRVLLKTIAILSFFILCGYLINNSKDIRHNRQQCGDYSYYSDYIKNRFDKIQNGFEIYFLDGSDFTSFSSYTIDDIAKVSLLKGIKKDNFNYLTFLYHLRLAYNVDDIKGFAISQRDLLNVINKPNSIILDMEYKHD